jgi:tetratricopeptide (TPR) repeat protein
MNRIAIIVVAISVAFVSFCFIPRGQGEGHCYTCGYCDESGCPKAGCTGSCCSGGTSSDMSSSGSSGGGKSRAVQDRLLHAWFKAKESGDLEAELQANRANLQDHRTTFAQCAVLVTQARIAARNRDWKSANYYFEQASRLDPNDNNLVLYRGHFEASRGDWNSAIRDFEEALRQTPASSFPEAHNNVRGFLVDAQRHAVLAKQNHGSGEDLRDAMAARQTVKTPQNCDECYARWQNDITASKNQKRLLKQGDLVNKANTEFENCKKQFHCNDGHWHPPH